MNDDDDHHVSPGRPFRPHQPVLVSALNRSMGVDRQVWHISTPSMYTPTTTICILYLTLTNILSYAVSTSIV